MRKTSLYDILQVIPQAEPEVIDAAYRRLCRKYHPDVNRDVEAGRRMNLFIEAYQVLRDPERRKAYDLLLAEEEKFGQQEETVRKAGIPGVGESPEIEAGRQVLLAYFSLLREQDWHKAYTLLSREDRANISREDFLEWQEAVSALFQLGEVEVVLHRTHRRAGGIQSAEFVAEGREVDVAADRWRAFVSAKTLVREDGEWRVRLGYEDVRALAVRFRLMAESLHPRVLNEEELLQLAGQEAYRAGRFSLPLSLGAFQVLSSNAEEPYPVLWEARKMSWISRSMDRLRLTDVLAWTEAGEGVLILPHTNLEQAHIALRKLSSMLMEQAALDGAEISVVWCASMYDGRPVEEWRGRLSRNLRAKMRQHMRTKARSMGVFSS